eukprot:7100542-Lingulodinium_polyedra.AAC.1
MMRRNPAAERCEYDGLRDQAREVGRVPVVDFVRKPVRPKRATGRCEDDTEDPGSAWSFASHVHLSMLK